MADYIKQLAKYGYPGFHEMSQRHIAPPRTSVEIAERHGMFDTDTGGGWIRQRMLRSSPVMIGSAQIKPSASWAPIPSISSPFRIYPDPLARGVSSWAFPAAPRSRQRTGPPGSGQVHVRLDPGQTSSPSASRLSASSSPITEAAVI